jgi:hypothetical protein
MAGHLRVVANTKDGPGAWNLGQQERLMAWTGLGLEVVASQNMVENEVAFQENRFNMAER